ncbi:unnamed protein product [Paramecium sonneborni]|uniref:Uncharacterized protein n=1 Tax=Paramecium sonneborni TaxID=65129 RepID=A0A8S1RU08_9CILI|nr:unnamed protein product [Paramecium sonneborni]
MKMIEMHAIIFIQQLLINKRYIQKLWMIITYWRYLGNMIINQFIIIKQYKIIRYEIKIFSYNIRNRKRKIQKTRKRNGQIDFNFQKCLLEQQKINIQKIVLLNHLKKLFNGYGMIIQKKNLINIILKYLEIINFEMNNVIFV